MRDILRNQHSFDFSPMDQKQIKQYELMDQILKKAPQALDLVNLDLTQDVDPGRGRPGMSAQQVLRFGLVKQLHQLSYERLYEWVHDSITLRRFCQCEFEVVPKPSTLQENIKKIRSETFEELSHLMLRYAKQRKIEDGKKTRMDTTTVESNIKHPTDSRLLEDSVRVITRLLKRAKKQFPKANIVFHDRRRAVKKRVYAIANVKKTEDRVPLYKELLVYAEEVLEYGHDGLKKLCACDKEKRFLEDLKEKVQLLERILDQTKRRVLDGESVPAKEKVLSLFELHTDVIEKGSRKPVFGHKICLTVGSKNLVLDCTVEEGNPADSTLFSSMLKRHQSRYGEAPEQVAVDGGFASNENYELAQQMGVQQISFSKRVGNKISEELLEHCSNRALTKFRSGIEGIISAMKRGVGLARCIWRGWSSFQAYVWSAIAAYNLKMLTRALAKA